MKQKLLRFHRWKTRLLIKPPIYLFFLSIFIIPLVGTQPILAIENAAQQQKNVITGIVTDTKGEAIIGANIKVEGGKTGSITDIDGVFKLDVPVGTKLIVSYIGFEAKEIIAQNEKMKIALSENSTMLKDVEVVAYGAQKKVTITGAISSVKGNELLKTPTGSVSNMLSGQLTGLTTVQYSGEPGADAANIFVRGKATWTNATPLIQVDGVERDFNNIDPNEIESITVLKDASATAVFGVRGANGVILITTKRGQEGKAKISFTTSTSIIAPTKTLEFANSYQYATFYNQMQKSDNPAANPMFSDAVIQKFKDHSDPIRFPDTNWVNYCLKDYTLQTQQNVNISGGTKTVRYFVSAGAYTQGGLFKQFGLPYDLTYQYNRFNYRSNLDIDVTKTTTLSLNLGGYVNNSNKPYTGQGSAGMLKNMYWATPFSSPGLVNGKMVYAATDYSDLTLPFIGGAGMTYYGGGFMSTSANSLNTDLILNQKLDFITKGFSARIKGSYNSDFTTRKNGTASIATYTPVLKSDGTIGYRKSGENTQIKYEEKPTEQGKDRNWYMEAGLNYDRSFGNHHFGALVLYNQSKDYYPSTYSDIPTGYVGLVGRVTYDWRSRYLAEFNVGYNGSENFAPDKRFGTFPAGSVGWVVSEEKFWKPIKPIIGYMKLRASLGLVGNDKVGGSRFMYTADPYGVNNNTATNRLGYGYNFGILNPTLSLGAYEVGKNNANVTWEKSFKQNYGVDASFINDRFKTSFDYFFERRKDILLQDLTSPGILGFSTPYSNFGRVNSWGWEVSLKWNDKIGDKFNYWVGLNLSYNQNKIIERKEAPLNNDYQYTKGHRIGANSLYQFWRYYDENTPALYAKTFGKPFPAYTVALKPGDCVYVDLDGNGVIDSNDMSRGLGYTDDPEYTAGSNMGFSWNNFDVTLQWTAAWNVSRVISDVFRQPFVSGSGSTQGGLLLYQYENTWTTENPSQSAAYPRATWVNASNNYAASTLYEKNSSYLRLKSLQVAYNFHFPFMIKLKLNTCQLAFSGYNLLTFTGYKWGDPESTASNAPSYPLTKTYSLSLKLGF